LCSVEIRKIITFASMDINCYASVAS